MLDQEELYREELAKLRDLCHEFCTAYDSDRSRPVLLLLTGAVTAQCARVYNLSPQGGALDPRTLFTGRPE